MKREHDLMEKTNKMNDLNLHKTQKKDKQLDSTFTLVSNESNQDQ